MYGVEGRNGMTGRRNVISGCQFFCWIESMDGSGGTGRKEPEAERQEIQEAGGTIENVSESSHSNPSFVLTFYAICHRLIYADGVPIQRSHLFLNILPERISPIGLHSIVWFYLSCYPGDFQNCHREKTNKIFLVKPHCLQR